MGYAEKRPGCSGCPAEHKGHSFVEPSGPTTAKVCLIGQGPGRDEASGLWDVGLQDYMRQPFIGRSGRKLNAWLDRVNSVHPELPQLRREDCRLLNVVQCHVTQGGKDRAPTLAEVAYCRRAHWQAWLDEMPNLQVVVPIGVPAIQAILGPQSGGLWAGGCYRTEL